MNINNGNLNSVVFLDIKKAFDTVDHKILLQKLACYGINGSSLKRIESYLKAEVSVAVSMGNCHP